MLFNLFACVLLASLNYAQSICSSQTSDTSNLVSLTYTPYVTPQVAPVTTVYSMIITTWYNVVDCRYVSIKRVDHNMPAVGPFTTRTSVGVLTITRIGCIQSTAVSTRGRGSLTLMEAANHVVLAIPTPDAEEPSAKQYNKRDSLQAGILAVAGTQTDSIPPDTQSMSVRAYGYLVQVNTALFALNLYNAGFNMTATCALLGDPLTQARLLVASVNPSQAASIICYAAQNGLYFNMSNAQLLSDLLSIIYSIDIKAGYTNNITAICHDLDLQAAGWLGIDATGVEEYICAGQPRPSVSASTISSSISGTSHQSTAGNTAGSGTGNTGLGSSTLVPPFANTTFTITSSTQGSVTTSQGNPWSTAGTGGTGGITSWQNFTSTAITTGDEATSTAISDTYTYVFPNVTAGINESSYADGRTPPTPTRQFSYDLWTTSTASESTTYEY